MVEELKFNVAITRYNFAQNAEFCFRLVLDGGVKKVQFGFNGVMVTFEKVDDDWIDGAPLLEGFLERLGVKPMFGSVLPELRSKTDQEFYDEFMAITKLRRLER